MRSPTPRAGIGTAVTPTGRSIGTRRTAGATTESTGMAARIRLADWWCHPRSVPDSETNGFDVWCKDSSMNIFGAREDIAVQAELLEPAGKSVVGHICLFADGMLIGRYEEVVLLRCILDFLRGTIRHLTLLIVADLGNL